uniref:Cyclin-like domain-containing protein n=1 Tax=Aegilops tauschii TaxID=37682 RepID=N1R0X7_AEGTA
MDEGIRSEKSLSLGISMAPQVPFRSGYHVLLGHTGFARFNAVSHYACLKLKMPGPNSHWFSELLYKCGGGGGSETQLSGSYASDIYTYLRTMEVEAPRRPAADYIETVQTDVTANMRAILIDWLVEVAEEYKLVADTLYLTVSYVDRFLSANPLGRNRLQLLGVAAMLIASKYEEISPPHVEDFCYITDNTYTRQELLTMESDILKLLNFEIGSPTIKTFLRLTIGPDTNPWVRVEK